MDGPPYPDDLTESTLSGQCESTKTPAWITRGRFYERDKGVCYFRNRSQNEESPTGFAFGALS